MTSESTIPNTASVDAQVNGPEQVTLYHESGRSIAVPAADTEFWMSQGYEREKFDLETLKEELPKLAEDTARTLTELITKVTEAGELDPSDGAEYAVAQAALRRFIQRAQRTLHSVGVRYPTKATGSTVRMLTDTGVETDISEHEAADYEARGYTKAS